MPFWEEPSQLTWSNSEQWCLAARMQLGSGLDRSGTTFVLLALRPWPMALVKGLTLDGIWSTSWFAGLDASLGAPLCGLLPDQGRPVLKLGGRQGGVWGAAAGRGLLLECSQLGACMLHMLVRVEHVCLLPPPI